MLAPVQVGRKVSRIQFSGLDTYAYIDHGTEYNVRHRVTGGRAGKASLYASRRNGIRANPATSGGKARTTFHHCLHKSVSGWVFRSNPRSVLLREAIAFNLGHALTPQQLMPRRTSSWYHPSRERQLLLPSIYCCSSSPLVEIPLWVK